MRPKLKIKPIDTPQTFPNQKQGSPSTKPAFSELPVINSIYSFSNCLAQRPFSVSIKALNLEVLDGIKIAANVLVLTVLSQWLLVEQIPRHNLSTIFRL
jgi:hypothetical protein